jgi:hypothetical protein
VAEADSRGHRQRSGLEEIRHRQISGSQPVTEKGKRMDMMIKIVGREEG